MKEHYMKLNKAAFEQIKSGEKTIEIRLFDEKRQMVEKGDFIYFSLMDDDKQVIKARILDLHYFPDFLTLFSADFMIKSGFGGYTKEAAIACMRTYYSPEKEKKYGVLGIEIKIEE